jgi:sugar (pentulose or hexulose) kinase
MRLEGDADCGGLISYNYISGEPVTGLAEGRPCLYVQPTTSSTSPTSCVPTLYASVGVLKIGNDILFKKENIKVDRITGHGGLFKTRAWDNAYLPLPSTHPYLCHGDSR